MVEAAWTVVQPILDVWKALPPRDFPNYHAGTWGPEQAQDLLRRAGREWRDPLRARGAVRGSALTQPSGKKIATANP